MNRDSVITKELSARIKGIAIVFMVLHHFLSYPSWYEQYVDFGAIGDIFAKFCDPLRLCIAIFAVLSGYAFNINKDTGLKQTMFRLLKFLINYWVVYVIFIIIGTVICGYPLKTYIIVTGAFGVTADYMCFCWYVTFYLLAMIAMVFVNKICKTRIWVTMIIIVICRTMISIIVRFHLPTDVYSFLHDFFYWFPTILYGYIIGELKIYDRMCSIKLFKENKSVRIIFFMILGLVAFWGPNIWGNNLKDFGFEGIYAVVLVYSLVVVLNYVKNVNILAFLGKYSTNIWYVHCVFFAGATGAIFKKYLYWSKNPVGIVVFGLAICILCSVALSYVQKKLIVLLFSKASCIL